MKDTYGYKPLSYELINLFKLGVPDFNAAEELIRCGADVNDQGDDKDENVLSEILMGYGMPNNFDDDFKDDNEHSSDTMEDLNSNLGESMIKIIRFFLDHGFDVDRNEGRHGAQCLYALTFSSFDRYIIDAIKLLLDSGAKDLPVEDGTSETSMSLLETERSFQDTVCHDHYLGNIYEAAYQIYAASEEGISYSGIDSFETAMGKRILRVMADGDVGNPVFFAIDFPQSKHENCFSRNLYFIFDNGYMILTHYASLWVDTVLPDRQLIDVSSVFSRIVGSTIEQITFEHNSIRKANTDYGQPLITLHTDNGVKLNFTINFGEVEDADRCAYFYYGEKSD